MPPDDARAGMLSRRGALTAMLTGLGGVLALSACGPGDAAPPSGSATDDLRIGLTEWAVSVPQAVAVPGTATLTVTNAGASRHRLVVEGTQGRWRSPLLGPGDRAVLRVRTAPGEVLALGCDVEGHGAHAVVPALRVADGEP